MDTNIVGKLEHACDRDEMGIGTWNPGSVKGNNVVKFVTKFAKVMRVTKAIVHRRIVDIFQALAPLST